MASVNKVILIGHLGADPELNYLANGDAVANLRVATSESWKDKESGERKEKTEWHRVVFFKRQAEIAGEYLKKGSQVYIEGRIQTRKWTDKDGQERYTTEVWGSEMKMLGEPPGGRNERGDQGRGRGRDESYEPAPRKQPPKKQRQDSFDDYQDDIPF